ncbi:MULTISPECIES: FidL-like protein [Providencia]|uniref:FidL-like protein n=1 Tax=Providencia TaxID=586 RepID=UPI0012B5C6CA|nr:MULTISPECIES: FidL-like protein [Providencia]MTC72443.1 hypothetical protein [Providencia sp. wls1914]QLR05645.1 hypothetical protein H0913_04570 [Providencia rettgeri]
MSNKKSVRAFWLLIISTILVFISSYVYYKNSTAIVPSCRATLKIDISDSRSDLKGYYLLSIIPNENDPEHHTFVMNGTISNDGKSYVIARKFYMKYVYQGGHFFSQVERVVIDPNDQAQNKVKIRGIPQEGQIYFVNIKRLSKKNYIFEENFSPLFICTI